MRKTSTRAGAGNLMATKLKEAMKMMNIMISMNMATMMAEDAGAAELRNPLNSGMRSKTKGIIHRLFGKKK